MNFFLDLNYNPFTQWQLELLIESFQKHNLQDNLIISINDTNSYLNQDFVINRQKHKNIFLHHNIGKKRGYEKLNSLYAMSWALKNNILKQPFFWIPLDCVIYSKPETPEDKSVVSYQMDPLFTVELVYEQTGNLLKNKKIQENWPFAGEFISFNKFPIGFFDRWIQETETLVFHQIKESGKFWDQTDRLALNLLLQEFLGAVTIRGMYDFESDMYSNFPKNFIHYDKGFLPIFQKEKFKYAPPDYISLGNPIVVLSEHYPSAAFYYMSLLAKNYLNKVERLK